MSQTVRGLDADVRPAVAGGDLPAQDSAPGAVPVRGTPGWEELASQFWSDAQIIVNASPQPQQPKGVLFILTQSGMKYTSFTVPLAARMKQVGWAVLYLDTPRLNNDPTGIPALDRFQSCFVMGAKQVWGLNGNFSDKRIHEWRIDWPNRIVEAEGINFHCCFEGRLGRLLRRYTLSIEQGQAKELFNQHLANADKALTVVMEMFECVTKSGFPVRIIGAEPGYVPTGIFAMFARQVGCDNDLDFISMSEGYGNYMRAGRAGMVVSVAAARVSHPGDRRIPSLPDKKAFQDWLASRELTAPEIAAVVAKAVGQRRGTQSEDALACLVRERLRKRLAEHRAAGGAVVCLFGKVLYDRPVWEDAGFIHKDIKDWVNDTIRNLTTDEVLLLIRPHPSEAVREYFGVPNEYFVDLIETHLDRTLYLDPGLIELNDFVDQLDAGLMWFGTAGIELVARGIPVVYCGKWAKVDYALSALHTPGSKEEYYRWLNDPKSLRVSDEDRAECAKYLVYLSEGGPAVPFDLADLSEKISLGAPAHWHPHAFNSDDPRTRTMTQFLADIVTAGAHDVKQVAHAMLRSAEPKFPPARSRGKRESRKTRNGAVGGSTHSSELNAIRPRPGSRKAAGSSKKSRNGSGKSPEAASLIRRSFTSVIRRAAHRIRAATRRARSSDPIGK